MERLIRQNLLLSFLTIALTSAILGGVIALAFFRADPVIQEVFVEVEAEPSLEPPLSPSRENLGVLTDRYIELSGGEEEWTASLVEETGAAVCDSDLTGADVMSEFGVDIELDQTTLDEFVDEVRLTCPNS